MRNAGHRLVDGPAGADVAGPGRRRLRRPRVDLPRAARAGHPAGPRAAPASACAHGDRVAYLGPNHPRSSRRCSPPGSSARCSSRSTGGWPRRSWPTSSPTAAPTCPRPRARRTPSTADGLAPVACEHRRGSASEYEALLGRASDRAAGRAGGPGRDLHDPLHLGHHRPAQGRHAHPRQHRLEQRQPAPRRRPGRRRGDAGRRADVPRRGAQPDRAADPAQGRPRGPGRPPSTRAGPGADRPAPGHLPVRRADDVPGHGAAHPAGRDADLSSVRSADLRRRPRARGRSSPPTRTAA